MKFTSLESIFFCRLPLFKRGSGFYVDELQGKYDFLSYKKKDGQNDDLLFTCFDEIALNINSFVSILHKQGSLSYTCTEKNLVTLFLHPEKIVINGSININEQVLTKYADNYKDGYEKGVKISVVAELGETYQSLPTDIKIELIKEFCQLCHKYSFFEGFAVPDCLKGIAYIQGLLFNGFKELSILNDIRLHNNSINNSLHPTPEETILNVKKGKEIITIDKGSDNTKSDLKQGFMPINVRSEKNMKAIETLWSLLLIPIEEYPPAVKSAKDVTNIVRQLFYFKNNTVKNNVDLAIFETRHRSLIEFLMRFSKLIIEGASQNNTIYCSLLKSSFVNIYGTNQQYNNIQVRTISSHWMKKNKEGLQNLKKTALPKPILDLINEIIQQNDLKEKPLTRFK